jgi:hypothetical protein
MHLNVLACFISTFLFSLSPQSFHSKAYYVPLVISLHLLHALVSYSLVKVHHQVLFN